MRHYRAFYLSVVTLVLLGCQDELKEKGYYSDLPSCEQYEFTPDDTAFVNCKITKWFDGKEKAVVFTWDDCCHGINEVREVFDEYNLKTTFFVNTAAIDDMYLKFRLFYKGTLNSVIKEALKKGHEVSSHTHDHKNLTKLTLNQVEEQFQLSSEAIYEKYGYYPTTLSHPESFYNEAIDSIMRLYFLDSRYSMKNDNDSTIRYLHIRTSYPLLYYKKNFDSFIQSTSDLYVYGGHQLKGGYEPLGGGKETLSHILNYITGKYGSMCWITSYEDAVLYKELREKVRLRNEKGHVVIDKTNIQGILDRYIHSHAILTLKFDGENLDFSSPGLVSYHFDGKDSYCTVDLRKTNEVQYERIEGNYVIQESMRNGRKGNN